MPELERMLELLSKDDLAEIIKRASKEDIRIVEILTQYLKEKLEFTDEDVRTEVLILLSNADDYIYMETNMFESDPDELFPPEKALALLAETILDGFYDKAEMMIGLGMLSEAKLFVRSVAEAVRYAVDDQGTLIIALCKESALRYADDLESYLNSDDILAGFGRRD